MERADIDQLIAAARTKRDSVISDAEAEYNRTIDALKLVRGLLPSLLPHENSPFSAIGFKASESVAYGALMSAVRDAVGKRKSPFSAIDITDELSVTCTEMKIDRVAVSKCLIRLCENKDVLEVEKGRGRRPSIYRLPPASTAAEEKIKVYSPPPVAPPSPQYPRPTAAPSSGGPVPPIAPPSTRITFRQAVAARPANNMS